MIKNIKQFLNRKRLAFSSAIVALTMLFVLITPVTSYAAAINNRKVTLSTSSAAASSATTTYTFTFTIPTTATIVKSFSATACDAPSGTCNTPSGFSVSASTISQPVNLGDASGWTVDNSTAGSLRLTKSGNATTPTGSQTVTFNNVQNPTTANQTFYLRMTSYSDAAWTTPVDTGTVAASTATQITLSGTMDESLTFCVGTSITGQNCGTVAGSSVSFGTFSASSTNTGTSVMAASSNATSGYNITAFGTTLTCSTCAGTPTIAALASQTVSTTGTPQFGFNLKTNTTPAFGANPSGDAGGTATANYNTANQYRFVSGDSISSSSTGTNGTTFTSAYIVNVEAKQPAGVYTTTFTYICTPNF